MLEFYGQLTLIFLQNYKQVKDLAKACLDAKGYHNDISFFSA